MLNEKRNITPVTLLAGTTFFINAPASDNTLLFFCAGFSMWFVSFIAMKKRMKRDEAENREEMFDDFLEG